MAGEVHMLNTSTIGAQQTSSSRKLVKVQMESIDGTVSYPLKACVYDRVTRKTQVVDWSRYTSNYEHLKFIDFPKISSAMVDLLIRLDVIDAHASLAEYRSSSGGPIARKTPLGWVCMGPTPSAPSDDELSVNYVHALYSECSIDSLVQNLEAVGMKHEGTYITSAEKLAEEIVQKSISFHYQRVTMEVPWIHSNCEPGVTANRAMADHRLCMLGKSLDKRPEMKAAYDKVICSYIDKGYVRAVSAAEVEADGDDQWFLPHFAIVRDDKATTKVRVVFDAAAKYDGTSINECMYAGPALQNDLVKVLLRFPKEPVVLTADINEMFLQG
ncbi:uncharacterized protein LOC135813062 [Sycon ciliatum]|uniref:uncharacterized protein LOC135813062 n=1 Tax=Sycon ciliatum TaxID=27933 RepID=UPI0031F65FE0